LHGENRDEAPLRGENRDEVRLRGENRDEVPLRGENRDEVPLRGENRDEAPLRGERARLRRFQLSGMEIPSKVRLPSTLTPPHSRSTLISHPVWRRSRPSSLTLFGGAAAPHPSHCLQRFSSI
jgi:hypothetical protein